MTEWATIVAVSALVTALLVEVLSRAAGPGFNRRRFGPVLALLVGVGMTVLIASATGHDFANSILSGFLAGASAMGLHDIASGAAAPA